MLLIIRRLRITAIFDFAWIHLVLLVMALRQAQRPTAVNEVTNCGLSDRLWRQGLLLVRGIDSKLGEGEEAGPFGETDADSVGVNLVETVDLHAALGWGGAAEDWMP